MFGRVVAEKSVPKLLSPDHHRLSEYHRWQAMLRILEIDAVKSVPCTHIFHPFVERLIGTIRREHLDHVFFWNAGDRESKLSDYQTYYNEFREHTSLGGRAPIDFVKNLPSPGTPASTLRWQPTCRWLYKIPVAG